MILSRYTLKNISTENINIPNESTFELPEKVLQFGTGVLLRGLPDYFIDKANQQGVFNGRIVVVKSTSHGDTSAFEKQDGLYTLCIRGIQNGEKIEENLVNASISRVLNAATEWEEILTCAHNSNMQIIISNTTEVGIQLINDDIRRHPPISFPGKLLAFLYERFQAFGGSERSGMVIIPTELIPNNGKKLEAIVLELAHLNGLEEAFIEWLECCNHFCNSLVDRIVPGKPDENLQNKLVSELGYKDELMTMSEVYRLWAIEGDEKVKTILSFAQADSGIIIEPDIDIYRELKLRLLNGTHTLSCGFAFLYGCDTVKEAMDNETVSSFISHLMQDELAPAIPYTLELEKAHAFGLQVLDRFRNPHIRHLWLNITMQYSSKMKMRCVPVLLHHYKQSDAVPELFALGFASYIYFMKATELKEGKYFGSRNGQAYHIQDEQAAIFFERWQGKNVDLIVSETLKDISFWETDLQSLPGFHQAVLDNLNAIIVSGIKEVAETILNHRVLIA